MQSNAARVLENYEYSQEYRGVRREEVPRLQVKEGKKPQASVSPLRFLLCLALLVALISLADRKSVV